MDLGVTNRVALVTGGSSGIGGAICHALAAEGVRVGVGYRTNRAAADRVVAGIEASGGVARAVEHRLEDPGSAREAVAGLVESWGGLDILVCAAWATPGWAPPDALAEATSPEQWAEQLHTNVEGTVRVVQAALPPMRAQGWGRVVLVSSGAADDGSPGLEQYAAAKAALHGLGRSRARGAGPAGILINVVLPGLIATERHRMTIPAPVLEGVATQTPIRRLATEEDVARVVAFLASAANGAVTGGEVRVSGGMRM